MMPALSPSKGRAIPTRSFVTVFSHVASMQGEEEPKRAPATSSGSSPMLNPPGLGIVQQNVIEQEPL